MRAKPVKSASQAQREANALKSIWSPESWLSLRTLVYCADLLERMLARRKTKKRKASKWQKAVVAGLRKGKTMKQIAAEYRQARRVGGKRKEKS